MTDTHQENIVIGSLYNNNVFFQVPNITNVTYANITAKKKNVVVFLVDVSGSMRGDYPHIRDVINMLMTTSPNTIFHCLTFGSEAKDWGVSGLPQTLYYGLTLIAQGIQLLIATVRKYINNGYGSITTVFISDGADGSPPKLIKYMN